MTILISSDHIWFHIIVAINRITGWKLGQNLILCYSLSFRASLCNLSEKFMSVLYYILSFCRPRNVDSLSRVDFDYSEEATFTDYEKIQNIVDNDSLGETAEKI